MLPMKWEKQAEIMLFHRKAIEGSEERLVVQLNRRLCGLDGVIEYRDLVSNFGINDCCGGKAGKETERKNKSWFIMDQEGAT